MSEPIWEQKRTVDLKDPQKCRQTDDRELKKKGETAAATGNTILTDVQNTLPLLIRTQAAEQF